MKKKTLKVKVMKKVKAIKSKSEQKRVAVMKTKGKRKLPPQAHHVVSGKFVSSKYAKAHPDKVEWVTVKKC